MSRSPLFVLVIALLLAALTWSLLRAGGDSSGAAGASPPIAAGAGLGLEEREQSSAEALPAAQATAVREALEVHAPTDEVQAGTDTDTALVDVLVLSATTGEPLEGIEIQLATFAQPTVPGKARRILPARDSRASDAQGRIAFVAPAGESLHVGAAPGAKHEAASQTVPALAPGERHTIELRVRLATRRVFHGRVVAAEDGHAIEGARVIQRLRGVALGPTLGLPELPRTDALGIFRFEELSTRPSILEIHAEGFAPLHLRSGAGHETPERARELRLPRTARLVVHVPDAGGERVWVRLTTFGFYAFAAREEIEFGGDDFEWSAAIARDGRCRLEGLLPGAPLILELRRGHDLVRREPVALTLEPGETREIMRSLGGTRILGTVMREDGTPIAQATIWLTQRTQPAEFERLLFRSYQHHSTVARATTTSEGRFELASVAPGSYWVGPAPGTADVMGLATAIEAREGEAELRVDLVLPPALYIRGRVLGPDGGPLADEPASVTSSASVPGLSCSASSDREGAFALGPMPPGEYRVEARGRESGASAEALLVPADTEDLVLQLEGGAVIAGRIVDAAGGELVSAWCRIFGAEGNSWSASTQADGAFRFGLPEGTYTALATASGARVSTPLPITVRSGDAILDLELRLEPGARLRVRYLGSEVHGCRVLWHGRRVASGGVGAGREFDALVPPGEVEVELFRGEQVVAVRRVILVAGEEAEVVVEP